MKIGLEALESMTIKELRECFLLQQTVPGKYLKALEGDSRQGARQVARLLHMRRLRQRREARRLKRLLLFESELWDQGFRRIAGVDEAGMAPLAGPVIAAAVILPHPYQLPGLNDSKKIPSERKRENLASRIKRDSISWAVGRADVEEIDRLNIYHSGLLAMRRAIEGLAVKPDYILVDARTIPHCQIPQRSIIRGDTLSASIAAASLIAKTTRDACMIELDGIYPGYGFASHKGYPTPEHLQALKTRGPLPIHRKSFAPVRHMLALSPVQGELFRHPP